MFSIHSIAIHLLKNRRIGVLLLFGFNSSCVSATLKLKTHWKHFLSKSWKNHFVETCCQKNLNLQRFLKKIHSHIFTVFTILGPLSTKINFFSFCTYLTSCLNLFVSSWHLKVVSFSGFELFYYGAHRAGHDSSYCASNFLNDFVCKTQKLIVTL